MVLRLTGLLVRSRARQLVNGIRRGPRARGARAVGALAVGVPLAYVGLFIAAFGELVARASPELQAAALALVAGVITLASLAAKAAAGDAVVAGSSENEFYLSRPIALPQLVLARAYAGVLTDFFDALFLLPVLLAAAITLRIGALGLPLACASSVLTQVAVVAASQAIQIAAVHLVPPRHRRLLWSTLSLAAALSVAALWVVATAFLRQPASLIAALEPIAQAVLRSPAALIVSPVLAARNGIVPALVALAALAITTAGALLLAWLVARAASRRGWEDAAPAWATVATPRRRRNSAALLSVARKDLLLLARDRALALRLLAMPIIFVGVQIFGAAGWAYVTASPRRIGMLAFSLAAYLATIGPLGHMQAERQAFWILRSVPVPLGRLIAQKAAAWIAIVVALAATSFAALVALAPTSWSAATLATELALVVAGAASVAALAVALGCEAADFTRPGRAALGVGTVYLFLLVAGLYNVVLVSRGEVLVRATSLYAVAIALYWLTGIDRASAALDADRLARRPASPGDGVAAAIVLFLGGRGAWEGAVASGEVPAGAAPWVLVVWAAMVGAAIGLPRLRARRDAGPRLPFVLAVVVCAACVAALRAFAAARPSIAGVLAPTGAAAVIVTAEELVARQGVAAALEQRWPARGARYLAAAVGLGVALASSLVSPDAAWIAGHVVAALARAITRRTWVGWIARLAATL